MLAISQVPKSNIKALIVWKQASVQLLSPYFLLRGHRMNQSLPFPLNMVAMSLPWDLYGTEMFDGVHCLHVMKALCKLIWPLESAGCNTRQFV